jgi:GNAT superfamily N-acetyltransferase
MTAHVLPAGVQIRRYGIDDYPELRRIQQECFPPPFPEELLWSQAQILSHTAHFPEGALCAEHAGSLDGSASSHIVRWHPDDAPHSWVDISAEGFLSNHDPAGNVLYGVDIAVRPAFRGLGIARSFYQARFEIVRSRGLDGFISGSRLSGYHALATEMTLEEYARQVIAGSRHDPVISPQMKAGLRPLRLIRDYVVDPQSGNAALLMAWMNPERITE